MNLSIWKHIMTAFASVSLMATVVPLAGAACLDMGKVGAATWLQPVSSQQNPESNSYESRETENAGIVGLWQIQFIAKGNAGIPDGTVVDSGYTTWHSDGTELLNSGKPPSTGSFCMGVWKQTGRFTYKLNHFAVGWDSSGSNFIGPANIRESVTLDRSGNKFTGTFTIDQYDRQGNVLAHVAGTITATRITVD